MNLDNTIDAKALNEANIDIRIVDNDGNTVSFSTHIKPILWYISNSFKLMPSLCKINITLHTFR